MGAQLSFEQLSFELSFELGEEDIDGFVRDAERSQSVSRSLFEVI